jgi:hypothetical protein
MRRRRRVSFGNKTTKDYANKPNGYYRHQTIKLFTLFIGVKCKNWDEI